MISNKAKKLERKYFPQTFEVTTWESLHIELEKLLMHKIGSADDLIEFWEAVSELDKIVSDKAAWLYINMTCFADKTEYRDSFNSFISEIEARMQPYSFKLKKIFYDSPFCADLPLEYEHLKKIISNEIELFREGNIPLFVMEQELAVKYGEMVSKMTVPFQGEEKTIQQLAPYLENKDRSVRETAWRLMYGRYGQDQTGLDGLFDELKKIRVQIARNAGFENYRDYVHKAKGRFSYTPADLLRLHGAIEKIIVPLVREFGEERKNKLGLDVLRPWDFSVDINGEIPSPFATHGELISKGAQVIARVDPIFGAEFDRMRTNGFFDAENRKGKAPGGYCYPLYEHGSSFIFMHAVGVGRDVTTLIHESGHAMHNMMSKRHPIFQYTNNPREVSELASMSMELISIRHWNIFYEPDVLRKVIKKELMDKISFLPWGAVVDAFQHWIYLNPDHSADDRNEYFSSLLDRFNIGGDWTGLEKEKAMRWMLQLHIFELPFYYIEYVMAQLGSIAMYRNHIHDAKKTVAQYKKFLALGYTKPTSEIYGSAGITFDFSEKYVLELADFIRSNLAEE